MKDPESNDAHQKKQKGRIALVRKSTEWRSIKKRPVLACNIQMLAPSHTGPSHTGAGASNTVGNCHSVRNDS